MIDVMPYKTNTTKAMTPQEESLLEDELGDRKPRLLLRSRTKIDTGSWLSKSPIWLCVTDTSLLLLAASKRRYCQQLPLSECRDSQYCHTSGALLLKPCDYWRFNTIAFPPIEGLKVLKHLQQPKQTKPSPVTEPIGA